MGEEWNWYRGDGSWYREYMQKVDKYSDYLNGSLLSTTFYDFELNEDKEQEDYTYYSDKLDEIVDEVLNEFLEVITISPFNGKYEVERVIEVVDKEDTETSIVYDIESHKISGLVCLSLGDRDLSRITKEEVRIVQRALLIWIYENI